MSLQENVKKYIAIEDKIKATRLKIAKMEEKNNRLRSKSNWINTIIIPFAKEMCIELSKAKYEILGPFGIGSETSVWFFDTAQERKDCNVWSIIFRPDYHNANPCGVLIKDYNVSYNHYDKNTIGALNGFNYPSIKPPADADLKWFKQYITNSKHKDDANTK